MTGSNAHAAPVSPGKRLVLLLMAAASAGYVCRVAITVVAPGIMHDFGLTQAQMGTVFSAFLLGYTIFQVPSGGLARPGRRARNLPGALLRIHPADCSYGAGRISRLWRGYGDSTTVADSRNFWSHCRANVSNVGQNDCDCSARAAASPRQ
jgi:hypothetical protein